MVIVSEGSTLGSANEIAEKVRAQVGEFDIKVTIIGHLQRGGAPSSQDRMLASRLGYAAVEGLVMGQENVMVGIVNDQITYTPFIDAITKEKPINSDLVRMAGILAM